MVSWGEFWEAEPEVAARGEQLLRYGIAYISTIARDGSPAYIRSPR